MGRLFFIVYLVGASIGRCVAHEPSLTFGCECLLQKNERPNSTMFTFERRQHWSDVQAYYQKICGLGALSYRGQTLLPETPLHPFAIKYAKIAL
ncbi:MAG: hypothetical protein H2057_02190 [Alphaproteobacteria bacterium]|nr:hypothetical protein [Alphaproteobacteria bacterium]